MNNGRTVWITGAGGLIGNCLVQSARQYAPTWRVRGLARADFDLLDFDAVRRAFSKERPQLVIHCAALSRTPVCQSNPDLARRNNVDVTALLSQLAEDISFIFFSTDLVFDGRKGNYVETDQVNPLSVYAETKAEAEQSVLKNPQQTVLRVGLNAGVSLTRDRAFNEQMRLAFEAGKTLDLYTDEFRCPIPAAVTAQAVWELVECRTTGIVHLAGSERLSRYEIGKLLAARWPQLNPKIIPALAKDHPNPPRPPDVSLNCSRVQKLLSFPLPKFSEWLASNPNEQI